MACDTNNFGLLWVKELRLWVARCLQCGTCYHLGTDGELHQIALDVPDHSWDKVTANKHLC